MPTGKNIPDLRLESPETNPCLKVKILNNINYYFLTNKSYL